VAGKAAGTPHALPQTATYAAAFFFVFFCFAGGCSGCCGCGGCSSAAGASVSLPAASSGACCCTYDSTPPADSVSHTDTVPLAPPAARINGESLQLVAQGGRAGSGHGLAAVRPSS
jgi:hypothetical protein